MIPIYNGGDEQYWFDPERMRLRIERSWRWKKSFLDLPSQPAPTKIVSLVPCNRKIYEVLLEPSLIMCLEALLTLAKTEWRKKGQVV